MTCLKQPLRSFFLVFFSLLTINIQFSFAQSLVLVQADTKVYDSNKEGMVIKLRLKEDTWVNYKGKRGKLIKISNFFGKDQEYPYGIFDGYVAIESILDTARREDYNELTAFGTVQIEHYDQIPTKVQTSTSDIGQYYIGMSKIDALAIAESSMNIGVHKYVIDLTFSMAGYLSELTMIGTHETALAVDAKIKEQVNELSNLLRRKYGSPRSTAVYPSFLEIETGNVFQYAFWKYGEKIVSLGIGEKNDLYYPIVTVAKQ